ncbi:MAG: hypothetical protein HKO90_05980 [Flavobacteriaceae bacterium]|nr:hypothetical protein [Flavobacteriaceae bacterium]
MGINKNIKKNYLQLLLLVGIAITLYGLITGRYLFLFLIIPLGFGFFRKEKRSE